MTSDQRPATSDKIDEVKIEEKLRLVLSEDDFKHALRTSAKAAKLALVYGVDVDKARLAGLLHDYGRQLTEEQMADYARRTDQPAGLDEQTFLKLLHGPAGAEQVRKELHLEDEAILRAIALHTLGSPVMTPLDKVIYLADKLELGREHEAVARLRSMIGRSTLDELFKEAYLHSLIHVLKKSGMLHPVSIEVWNSMIKTDEKKKGAT